MRDATPQQIDDAIRSSHAAFLEYKKLSFSQRAAFMRTVAKGIESRSNELIETAAKETNLTHARLKTERTRTVFQWNGYADACEKGDWLNCRIDTSDPLRVPVKPDLRKTMVPLGPVVVFGASNFPFAYSTAGGDTASAFAAGCTVVVKAHPAHNETSAIMADIIQDAVRSSELPEGTFNHIYGSSFETGRLLVQHNLVKAVGFTGSVSGGRALFDWANQREIPIPVFAEMGSVNPVFIFPDKLRRSPTELATMLSASVTLGLGQFCTKPGLIIAMKGEGLNIFKKTLADLIANEQPGKMLHNRIANSYLEKRKKAFAQDDVVALAVFEANEEGSAAIASVNAATFLSSPVLHEEVFGPFSLIVECAGETEMQEVASSLRGQLTTSVHATDDDLLRSKDLIIELRDLCGRIVYNGVPTGVEVALSMNHGGPYPATTDSRFTAVGADAIKRFARPICFQNWPNEHLPGELKNENPLGFWRTVNNELTRDPIH